MVLSKSIKCEYGVCERGGGCLCSVSAWITFMCSNMFAAQGAEQPLGAGGATESDLRR